MSIKINSLNSLATAIALVLLPLVAPAANLLTALEAAMQNDPRLREAEASLLAAREAKPQAWSALKPQINGNWSETLYGKRNSAAVFTAQNEDGDLILLNQSQTDITQLGRFYQVEARQTLFRWDQFLGLDQASQRILQAEADYRFAEQDLFQRVSQRYFDVLGAQSDLIAVQSNKEAVARQLDQAETRFEVGLIAITDVREAQAAYDEAVAQEIAAKRSLGTAKELLREVTGEYYEELLAPGELPLLPPSPADEDNWVDRALEQNLQVVSARFGVEIASLDIRGRRSQHYPTLDLVATYQDNASEVDRDQAGLTLPIENDFDDARVVLQFSLPIYSGGFRGSRVKEAVYLERAAKERLERTVRETERLTRDSYAGVLSEIARVGALQRAVESSRTALQATEAGFEVGTRTTVDVLLARQSLARSVTNFERSRYVYLLNVISLKLASGQLTEEDLLQINQSLTYPVREAINTVLGVQLPEPTR
jgi:outer membrane protein